MYYLILPIIDIPTPPSQNIFLGTPCTLDKDAESHVECAGPHRDRLNGPKDEKTPSVGDHKMAQNQNG